MNSELREQCFPSSRLCLSSAEKCNILVRVLQIERHLCTMGKLFQEESRSIYESKKYYLSITYALFILSMLVGSKCIIYKIKTIFLPLNII